MFDQGELWMDKTRSLRRRLENEDVAVVSRSTKVVQMIVLANKTVTKGTSPRVVGHIEVV